MHLSHLVGLFGGGVSAVGRAGRDRGSTTDTTGPNCSLFHRLSASIRSLALRVWQGCLPSCCSRSPRPHGSVWCWNSIHSDNSFPVNAARQAYLLTAVLQAQIVRLARERRLHQLAPVLTFQSSGRLHCQHPRPDRVADASLTRQRQRTVLLISIAIRGLAVAARRLCGQSIGLFHRRRETGGSQ